MKTYAAIKAEIAKLEKAADAARKTEVAGVVGRIKEAIAAYSLTAQDLGLGLGLKSAKVANGVSRSRSVSRPAAGVPKYRDPSTGQTWTGRGRPPQWIVDANDRDAFLIASASKSNGRTSRRFGSTKKVKAAATKRRMAAPKTRSATTPAPASTEGASEAK